MSGDTAHQVSSSGKPDEPENQPESKDEKAPPGEKTRKTSSWKPTEDDKRLGSLALSVLGGISAITSLVALYARGSGAIVVWSAVVVLLMVIAIYVVRLTQDRQVTISLLWGVTGVVVIAGLAAGGIFVYVNRPAARPIAAPSASAASSRTTAPATSTTSLAATTPPATPKTSPDASPDASPDPSPHTPPVIAVPAIRHQGTLVLLGNGTTGYNLDSTASDWGKANGSWVWQNIQYFPDSGGVPALNIANAPASDVVLGAGGHWTYQDCKDARYLQYGNPQIKKNNPVGPAVNPGHGICVLTFDNTSTKTDGGHYALLVVVARTSATLTLRITVWQ
jgi:hypothetical protein